MPFSQLKHAVPSFLLFLLLLCSKLTVTCLATCSTAVQWVILQGIHRVKGRYTVQASSSFHVNWQTKGVLVFLCLTFLSPMQMEAGGRMPDRSFQSKWTEMDFGSYTALEEMEKPTSPRGGELSDWMTEISRKQITMPLHRRGRKRFISALGTNAKQTQEEKSYFNQHAGC